MTLRDQRTMVGPGRHRTVEDVERAWQDWIEAPGNVLAYRKRRGDLSMDLRESDRIVVAYVSGGKWIADCPICNGGIAVWRENPRGACLDCGTIFRVDHPSEKDRARVEELLAARPDPSSRSWHRHRDEPIERLEAENELLAARDRVDRELAGSVRISDVERILGRDAATTIAREVG